MLRMNSRFIRGAIFAVALCAATSRAELNRLTDYNAAVNQAKAENKIVLMDFTGSDWCGWCMRLKAEVFDTPEFAAFARANLVMLEVDFPRGKTLSAEQHAANMKLAKRFEIEGYPTIVLVNGAGHAVGQLGYMPGGPSAFINELKKVRGATWKAPDNSAAVASEPPVQAPATQKPAAAPEPLWGGTIFPAKRYDELKVTGLSGPANRRFAIVNNQTFAPGETAKVKLKGVEVKVLCKEIRAKSVIIQVEGATEPKELFLDGN